MSNRYDTSGSAEGRYQAGSNDLVLENLLGMTDVDEMEFIEFDALLALQRQLIDEVSMDQPITAAMVCDWHRRWLGEIYAWAGNFRSVNMAKGDFHFAVAHLIGSLMAKFESQQLKQFTPTDSFDKPSLIEALAITHVEFILIHPFRDGNGRLGRLLMVVMALQAGYPLLEFSHIENNKEAYFSAIQSGIDRHYEPMKKIVANVLANSLAKVE